MLLHNATCGVGWNSDMGRNMIHAKIITIYDPNPNYGNRLQNYASQTLLEKMGCTVDSISYQKKIISGKKLIKLWLMRLSGFHLPGDKLYWKYYPRKVKVFEAFNKEFIKTEKIHSLKDIGKTDYFILGSDQVWNPTWYDESELKKELFLLTFAEPELIVCLSPSFGTEILSAKWVPWFEKYLGRIPRISVREEAGAKIIKKLTGKNAVVTIDPTLMLNKEEWLKIAKSPIHVDCDKNYIFTYFLGGRSQIVERDLKVYSEKLGDAPIYNLLDYSQPDVFIMGPSEFVYMIAHAKLVVTDSFHACIFAFLFGKPFLCYDRQNINNMNSRMDTLFSKFDLRRKYVNSGLPNELFECNYETGYKVLDLEREKLLNLLKESMHMD